MHRLYLRSLFVLLTLSVVSLAMTLNVMAATTVTLEKAIHFLATDGSDVLIKPGTYQVEAAIPWILLIPGERRDALLLEATTTHHEEDIHEPIVRLIREGDEQSVHLLLPGGKGLEAIGTESGIRSRAVKRSRIKKPSIVRKTISRRPAKKSSHSDSQNVQIQKLTHQVTSLQKTIQALQNRLSKLESAIQISNSGNITISSSSKVYLNGSAVEISSGMVNVQTGMAKFSGVMKSDTVITNSVVSSSYTPGAGNIW